MRYPRLFSRSAGVLWCLAFAVTVVARGASVPTPRLDVMPAPARVEFSTGRLAITERLSVAVTGHRDARLDAGIRRALTRWGERTGWPLASAAPAAENDATVVIRCEGPGLTTPALGENEAYTLEITLQRATLTAPTVVGALRGLETLLQLLEQDAGGFHVPALKIDDQPRFPWRGLMIDVCRHWQPLEVIKRNLDAMALVKLNVLHLHLTDDQGFRIESRQHPELAEKASDGNYFTQEQMRELIAYATARGIRVVPEFDVPSHAAAWAVSHPEFASAPGPYALQRTWPSGVVLDPTNEDLYGFLDSFFGEMAALFPDAYLHVGGDENNGKQWNANPRIQAFIRERGLKDNHALQTYFNRRLTEILRKHGKRMVGWDEIHHPDLPLDSTIHAWRGLNRLNEAVRKGYTAILSNGYYIDLMYPAAVHYLNDPLPADSPVSAAEQPRVLGGEATMWAEWVTPETIDSRIWPRTAAIAERFWSPRDVNDVPEMYRRLARVSARLAEVGARHEANYEPMLRRLTGGELDEKEFRTFRRFADAIEPLKRRARARMQPNVTTLTPLTGLVDCVRVESVEARNFTTDVNAYLFGGREGAKPQIEALQRQLAVWRETGRIVADEIAPRLARLQSAAPIARQLAIASEVGLEALLALQEGRSRDHAWVESRLALVPPSTEPSPVAVEVPVLPAIRLLIVAAANQEQRQKLSRTEWENLLRDGAMLAARK